MHLESGACEHGLEGHGRAQRKRARAAALCAAPREHPFTGHEHDGDLGLINMNGRMYDPELGQFLSPDPYLQQPYGQGLNRYAYVNNNPLNLVDPSGFATEDNLDGDLTAGAIVGGHVTAGALIACGFGACGGGAAAIAGSSAGTAAAAGGGAAASGLGPATGLTTGVASFIGGAASVATSFLDMEYNFTGTYSDTVQSSKTVPASKSAHAPGGGTPNVGRVVNSAIAPVQEMPPELSLFNPARGALAQAAPAVPVPGPVPLPPVPTFQQSVDAGNAIFDLGYEALWAVNPWRLVPDKVVHAIVDPVVNAVEAVDHLLTAVFNPDQQAVIDLAKEGKRLGLSRGEAEALVDLARKEGLPARGPESHPGRPHGSKPHIHVGPVNHIPVKP